MLKPPHLVYILSIRLIQGSYPSKIPTGADPGFSKGGAKLTQWRWMRRLSSRARMYGSALLHKIFITPPIFPSEEQKKKKPQPTAITLWTIT